MTLASPERTRERGTSSPKPPGPTRGSALGVVAGLIGISCCIYPVALFLLGLATASAAADLGNRLYAEWAWGFRGAAILFAGAAVVVQRRRAARCGIRAPSVRSFVLPLVAAGVVTYAAVYVVTTWLGRAAG